MFCTDKEWKYCNAEKMGHEGCYYNNDKNKKEVEEYMRKFEICKDEELEKKGLMKNKIIIPKRATMNSVAYDICSPIDFIIVPGDTFMLWTGIKAKFNNDEALLINVRSSMGKKNIMLANTQGWIDSDYYSNKDNDGNIGIMLHNFGNEIWQVKRGDRIAQCMFIKYFTTNDDNAEGERTGGFGSTNK